MNHTHHQHNPFCHVEENPRHIPRHEHPQLILSSPVEDTHSTTPLFDFDTNDLAWADDDGFDHPAQASAGASSQSYLQDDDILPKNQTSLLNDINALLKPETGEPWHLRSDLVSASFSGPSRLTWPGSPSVGSHIYGTSLDSGYASSLIHPKAPQKAGSVHSTGSGSAYRVDKKNRSRSRAASAPPLVCLECNPPRTFNNQSELKKDQLRHIKPYRCEIVGCAKKSAGFPTQNDLERHRKAVHGLEPALGDKSGYRCVLCVSPAYTEKKFWPRKDNFKSHILRKHRDHDVNAVIEQSKGHYSMSSYDSGLGSQIDTVDENPFLMEEAGMGTGNMASGTQDTSFSSYFPLENELAGMGLGSTDIMTSPVQYMPDMEDNRQQGTWYAHNWADHRYPFDL